MIINKIPGITATKILLRNALFDLNSKRNPAANILPHGFKLKIHMNLLKNIISSTLSPFVIFLIDLYES